MANEVQYRHPVRASVDISSPSQEGEHRCEVAVVATKGVDDGSLPVPRPGFDVRPGFDEGVDDTNLIVHNSLVQHREAEAIKKVHVCPMPKDGVDDRNVPLYGGHVHGRVTIMNTADIEIGTGCKQSFDDRQEPHVCRPHWQRITVPIKGSILVRPTEQQRNTTFDTPAEGGEVQRSARWYLPPAESGSAPPASSSLTSRA